MFQRGIKKCNRQSFIRRSFPLNIFKKNLLFIQEMFWMLNISYVCTVWSKFECFKWDRSLFIRNRRKTDLLYFGRSHKTELYYIHLLLYWLYNKNKWKFGHFNIILLFYKEQKSEYLIKFYVHISPFNKKTITYTCVKYKTNNQFLFFTSWLKDGCQFFSSFIIKLLWFYVIEFEPHPWKTSLTLFPVSASVSIKLSGKFD